MDPDLEIKNRLEIKPVKGATEVWFIGYDGADHRVFRGSPADARRFKKDLAASIESVIVAQHEDGCTR